MILEKMRSFFLLGHRDPGDSFFKDFIILLDLYYDPEENEVLFVKIGAKVLDLWLDTSSGTKWSKCSL